MIFDILSSAKTGANIGSGLVDLYYGKNLDKVSAAYEELSDYEKTENYTYLKSAYEHFTLLKNDSKDYIRALSLYGLAICHTYNAEFRIAYQCLDDLQEIELGVIQAGTETIADLQKEGLSLEDKIREIEQEYNADIEDDKGSAFSKYALYFIVFVIILALGFVIYNYLA